MNSESLSMNESPRYVLSSFRQFAKNERHITRTIPDHVLLLGLSGVLRFSEDGVPVEVRGGEYYIQQGGRAQSGPTFSDEPVYFYAHFYSRWSTEPPGLVRRGRFDVENMLPMMQQLVQLEQSGATLVEKNEVLCRMLVTLYRLQNRRDDTASSIVDAMIRRMTADLRDAPTLESLSEEFYFSTNYLIRIFREATGRTPHAYLLEARLRQARLLLETTNATAETVAMSCGFADYPHFFRMFTRKYGTSPSQYRRTCSQSRGAEDDPNPDRP